MMAGVRRLGKWLGAFAGAILVMLLALAGRACLAQPLRNGTLTMAGLMAPVELLRDVDGITHVRAASERDASFGLGVAHAQDRLWQMEFQRRLAAGRLAEVLGAELLPTDRLFRVLGLRRLAREHLARYDAATRAMVDAYVAGVNAVIAATPAYRLPVEFAILRITPEPWQPEDVIAYSKVLALSLSTNFGDELLRERLVGRVGEDGAAALMPPSTLGGPTILPEGLTVPGGGTIATPVRAPAPVRLDDRFVASLLQAVAPAIPSLAASNNWVVSGARSRTGRPLLANDPHLAAQAPSVWYLAHLEGGALNVIGGTFPGLPGIAVGHNTRIAWGATNVMADVQDLYVERLNAANQAEFAGRWEPMQLRPEAIRVKGRDEPERLIVRTTRHGPLVSDVLPRAPAALALRWTALGSEDRLLEAFRGINLASTWEQFTAAASLVTAPMQNFVYADVDGNIGYFAPGVIPVRASGDGTRPVPGWTGEHEWIGFVQPSAWPRLLNPTRGFVASANNPVFPDPAPYLLSTNWEPGYRAARISALIESADRLSLDDFARMQGDTRSAEAVIVLPWLRRARPTTAPARAAMALLASWHGILEPQRPEPAIYETWKQQTIERLLADELGPELWEEYARLPHWMAKALNRVVLASDDRWCDDVRTAEREACEQILGTALDEAATELADRFGTSDPARWRWADLNEIWFPHRPFHNVPILAWAFSRHRLGRGDAVTVNPVLRVREQTLVSSYRQLIDLSNLDASRVLLTLGQSGLLLDRRYDDYLDRWSRVEHVPMRYSHAAVDAAVSARLTLKP